MNRTTRMPSSRLAQPRSGSLASTAAPSPPPKWKRRSDQSTHARQTGQRALRKVARSIPNASNGTAKAAHRERIPFVPFVV